MFENFPKKALEDYKEYVTDAKFLWEAGSLLIKISSFHSEQLK